MGRMRTNHDVIFVATGTISGKDSVRVGRIKN